MEHSKDRVQLNVNIDREVAAETRYHAQMLGMGIAEAVEKGLRAFNAWASVNKRIKKGEKDAG